MALTKVSNSMLVQPVNHNILINPSFTVKQRGDVIDHDGNTSYGPDRWRIRGLNDVGGTKVESRTEVDAATGINKLVVKHEGTTSSAAHLIQIIEAVNIQGLYSKEMTFSFGYSDTGGSGIPQVRVLSYNSSATSKELYLAVPTSLGNNRWTCTVTLSTTDGTIPDPNEKGMQVLIWPNEQNNAPSEWSVWETKLEVGSVVTPFIARSHGEELALCHRYYYRFGSGTGFGSAEAGSGANTYLCAYSFRHPVPMRAAPTMTLISGETTYFAGGIGVTIGTPTGDLGNVATSSMKMEGSSLTADGVNRFRLSGFSFTRGMGYAAITNFVNSDAEL